MTTHAFNLKKIHASWRPCVDKALSLMDATYLETLSKNNDWLPGPDIIFNALTMPVDRVNYVLLGETPYPRAVSANGYAFWDADVKTLWSDTGLNKQVNRATSLRNMIKMLLVADKKLSIDNTTQSAIVGVNKDHYVKTNDAFFQNFIKAGFLLLNACPVLQPNLKQSDAVSWQPFTIEILHYLLKKRPDVRFLFLGAIAKKLDKYLHIENKNALYAEHPYNLSFIKNNDVIDFFKPLHLLNQ